MANYALEVYTASYNTTTLIGMAKDGHNIIGPYQERAEDAETGDLWNCVALDICNGIKSGDTYSYVAVVVFPYYVGCYGPGAYVTFNPRCSTNLCVSYSSTLISLAGLVSAILLIGAIAAF